VLKETDETPRSPLRRRLIKGVLATAGLAALEGLNLDFTYNRIKYNIEHALKPDSPYDLIVVLGAGNSFKDGKEVPAFAGQLRVIAAHEEHKNHPKTAILYSGGAISGTKEAELLEKFGQNYSPVSNDLRFKEELSTDSVSEIHQLIEFLKSHPEFKKIAVSTNKYHMVSIQVLAKELGIDLYPFVAEQVLKDTGNPELMEMAKKYRNSPSYELDKEHEQTRLAMLILDPDSRVSHERAEWEKVPGLKKVLDKTRELLTIAGKKLFPLES